MARSFSNATLLALLMTPLSHSNVSAAANNSSRFLWGTATAAYQVEGSRNADGRTPSVWDAFDTAGVSDVILSVKPSGECRVTNCDDASVADDDYLHFEDSVGLTAQYGFEASRLSIAMPRIMTYIFDEESMQLKSTPNPDGIAHYMKVLSEYQAQDIKVACTMWHWDLPLAIEEAAAAFFASNSSDCRGGSAWLCFDLVSRAFADYAKVLMQNFSEQCSYWITLNEPLTIVMNGYAGSAPHAPGRCGDRSVCYDGNDLTEPYLATKGLILAHAQAFRAWENAGKPGLGCGITLNGDFRVPYDASNQDDVAAAERDMEWQAAIFADPIHFGKWPASIDVAVSERLADLGWAWTADEVKLVNGTHDGHFFMNTYTSGYTRAGVDAGCGWNCDKATDTSAYDFETGVPIGTPSSNGWLFNYGPGIGELMTWYNDRYPGLSFIVTENGWGNATAEDINDDLMDYERCEYYRGYIGNMSSYAAKNNISVTAYFAWSLMDNYEWADGYTTRFGLTYVDYETQIRTPKLSALWFQTQINVLTNLPTDGQPLPSCDSAALRQKVKEEKASMFSSLIGVPQYQQQQPPQDQQQPPPQYQQQPPPQYQQPPPQYQQQPPPQYQQPPPQYQQQPPPQHQQQPPPQHQQQPPPQYQQQPPPPQQQPPPQYQQPPPHYQQQQPPHYQQPPPQHQQQQPHS